MRGKKKSDMTSIRKKWREFRQWQLQPHTVMPLSEEYHTCPTCKTEYQGNYCPRCGQSARIGRYSFKNAFLLFLDVWGLGNRGMFRSIRDLVLRPGYMIRDYLAGMQMAYFPPFKMFFLLTTLSLIISTGFNIKGKNYLVEAKEKVSIEVSVHDEGDEAAAPPETDEAKDLSQEVMTGIIDASEKYPNIFSLCILIVLSGFLYVFFRKSPAIPGMRYSEFLVSLVYVSNMYSIYSIVMSFFCVNNSIQSMALLMTVVPLKQLSGFSWKKTILYMVLTALMVMLLFFIMGIASVFYLNAIQ